MAILRTVARIVRKTGLALFIILASCTYAYLVCKYAFGSGSKTNVQKKNLHMIKSTGKSIKGAVRKIQK